MINSILWEKVQELLGRKCPYWKKNIKHWNNLFAAIAIICSLEQLWFEKIKFENYSLNPSETEDQMNIIREENQPQTK